MRLRLSLTAAMVLVVASTHVAAHELPIRSYTTADGLADNCVHRIIGRALAPASPTSTTRPTTTMRTGASDVM